MKAILTRTSVRKYLDKQLSKGEIEQILRAGFAAPSAKNTQPWEFIVVENKQTLATMSTFSPYAGLIKNAAMGMVVCGNTDRNPIVDYCQQDCAAATENMLVAANDLGIGSCWIGIYPHEERMKPIRDLFNLPENIVPLWMIAFGYPDQKIVVKDKWDESKIHYEKF